jgi:hypothetical protein
MNLEVSDKNVCKVLYDVRLLIHDCLLPRISQLEEELRLLREVTWPVCQSLRETSQLTDIENKRKFLMILDPEEIEFLLKEKASVSARPLEYSTSHLIEKF